MSVTHTVHVILSGERIRSSDALPKTAAFRLAGGAMEESSTVATPMEVDQSPSGDAAPPIAPSLEPVAGSATLGDPPPAEGVKEGDGKASEMDNVLDKLGVRHVDEQEARKQVLERAEKRWVAALEARRRAALRKEEQKASAGASASAPKKKPAVDVSPEPPAPRVEEPGLASTEASTMPPPPPAPKDPGKQKAPKAAPAPPPASEGQNSRVIREAMDEAYQVRMGDLTPFEEEAQRRRQASSSSSSSGAGSEQERLKKKKLRALQQQQREGDRAGADATKKDKAKGQEGGSREQRPSSRAEGGAGKPERAGAQQRGATELRRGPGAGDKKRPPAPAETRVPQKGAGRSKGGAERGGAAPSSSSASTGAAPRGAAEGTVACPVCGREVAVKDPARPDAELNEHLDRCMRRQAKRKQQAKREPPDSDLEDGEVVVVEDEDGDEGDRRAPPRRSGRRRGVVVEEEDWTRRRAPRVKDEGEEERDLSFFDDEESEEETEQQRRRRLKRAKGKKKRRAAEEEEEDEEYDGEDDEDEEGEEEEERAAPRRGRGEEEGAAAREGRVRGALVADDFSDADYQQRLSEYEAALQGAAGQTEGGQEGKQDEDEEGVVEVSQARGEGLDQDDQSLQLEGGFHLSPHINGKLYWYQRTGVRWLWELHKQGAGGILGDEMGLGKTVQLSAFLGGLHESGQLQSALIVCPATLIAQWVSELFAWAPRLRVVVLHRSGRAFAAQPVHKVNKFVKRCLSMRHVVCVTTYESLKGLRDVLLSHAWTYAVLDEGQKIRNPDAEVTVCAKQLATVHRLILSGTPIQNNLRELWSLFDFVFPGRLGTLPAFETEMAIPIRMGGYSNASQSQAQLAYRCALVLRDLINPYLLRRMKKDIMEILPMPKKTEQVLFCKLTAAQRALYRATLSSPEIQLIVTGKASHFRAISVLRKICNHADLAADPEAEGRDLLRKSGEKDQQDGSDDEDDVPFTQRPDYGAVARSGKLQVLEEVLPRWKEQGHKVLLFSQTRQMLNILERMVSAKGWRYMRMDGNTGVGARPGLIDRFNHDPSIFIFLLTTRTGGLGINLTGADRVILYDPDWNPQTDVQARERAWRLGQKRPVTIYRLVTSGTIEEKIYQRQIFKTAMTNRVLHDPKQRRLFSSRELSELFTLKEDFDDEDAPNDTADVFSEGVVKQAGLDRGLQAKQRSRRKRAREQQDQQQVKQEEGEEVDQGAARGAARARGEEQQEQDDCKILKAVFSGKGLSSVLSHDIVEGGSVRESNTSHWLEVHDNARRVAERAARVLRESSEQVEAARVISGNHFAPTWTGRSGSAGGSSLPVFGRNPVLGAAAAGSGGGGRGLAATGGNMLLGGAGAAPSSSILSRFRERQGGGGGDEGGGSSSSAGSRVGGGGESKYVSLMDRIKRFLRERGPAVPTAALLQHFQDVPQTDAVIFKALLKQLASFANGHWTLKTE